jgi:hypothetical protein
MRDGTINGLPGDELVRHGLADLSSGRLSDESLLVLIAAPRLRALGIQVPDADLPGPHEHLLYSRIEERLGPGAHSYYNSLIRRIVSYTRALEREKT